MSISEDKGLQVNNTVTLTDIDKENYTISLLQQCSVIGLIQQEKIYMIKKIIEEEFVETASQYTKRESSTLPRNTADEIYRSVLFGSDVFLLSFNDHNRAVDALKNMSFGKIIQSGKEQIMKYFCESKIFYNKARKYNLDVSVYEYRYVMDKAFDEFCVNYSARFNALEVCANIDYPLMYKKPYAMTSNGVMFIHEYYKDIMLENRFCSLFDINDIRTLLSGYGNLLGCRYTDILFNIAEIAANNYFVRLLNKKNGFCFEINKEDIDNIYITLHDFPNEDIHKAVMNALKTSEIMRNDPMLYMYLKKYAEYFADELFTHVMNKNVENFVVMNKYMKP